MNKEEYQKLISLQNETQKSIHKIMHFAIETANHELQDDLGKLQLKLADIIIKYEPINIKN